MYFQGIKGFSHPTPLSFMNLDTQDNTGIRLRNVSKPGILDCITGARNELLEISFNSKKVYINYKKMSFLVNKSVAAWSKGSRTEWANQERITLLSMEINKQIDLACEKYNTKINNNDKKYIFNRMILRSEGAEKLDPGCAQSSISHAVYGNKYFSKKINNFCFDGIPKDVVNDLKNRISAKLTDFIFMQECDAIDLSKWRSDAAYEIALFLRMKNTMSVCRTTNTTS